jgi:hypothetical protein
MDHQTFDRLARFFATAASRRTTWRALLAGALLAATTPHAAAQRCPNGKPTCEPSGECCPGKCFTNEFCEVCCTGDNIICHTSGGPVCCLNNEDKDTDPCRDCNPPRLRYICQEAITGSYRRR